MPQIYRKIENRNKREGGNLPSRSPPGSPPGRPSAVLAHASQLLRPRQASTEVTPVSTSSPRRHLVAARAPGHLGELHVAAPTLWTSRTPPASLPRLSSPWSTPLQPHRR